MADGKTHKIRRRADRPAGRHDRRRRSLRRRCAYGITAGLGLAEAGRIGSIAAAEAISHVGPRPQRSLKELIG